MLRDRRFHPSPKTNKKTPRMLSTSTRQSSTIGNSGLASTNTGHHQVQHDIGLSSRVSTHQSVVTTKSSRAYIHKVCTHGKKASATMDKNDGSPKQQSMSSVTPPSTLVQKHIGLHNNKQPCSACTHRPFDLGVGNTDNPGSRHPYILSRRIIRYFHV